MTAAHPQNSHVQIVLRWLPSSESLESWVSGDWPDGQRTDKPICIVANYSSLLRPMPYAQKGHRLLGVLVTAQNALRMGHGDVLTDMACSHMDSYLTTRTSGQQEGYCLLAGEWPLCLSARAAMTTVQRVAAVSLTAPLANLARGKPALGCLLATPSA